MMNIKTILRLTDLWDPWRLALEQAVAIRGQEMPGSMTRQLPSLRVLIVDDEALIRWSIAETLAQDGHRISEASDAKGALARLGSEPHPDVILLDFRLPDSNDLKLLERIRSIAPSSSVIVMTAYGTAPMEDGARELGAFRVVGKPIEMSELPELVRQAYMSRPSD